MRFAFAVAVALEHGWMYATELFEFVASVEELHIGMTSSALRIDCACLHTLSRDVCARLMSCRMPRCVPH